MIDVVCYYVDLGHPEYEALIDRAFKSAKAVMDCTTTVLTTTPRPWMRKVAERVAAVDVPNPITQKNLCLNLTLCQASYIKTATVPVAFVGPDVTFRAPPPFGDWDIALLWRDWKPDQTINNSVVLARPGCDRFWLHYANVTHNLPRQIHHWWCDQIGLSLMTGVCNRPGDTLRLDDARVHLLEAVDNCDVPERATDKAWALSHTGNLKGRFFDEINRRVRAA
jgi:hypothetical protein